MSYVFHIWKQNILNTATPSSYDEAEKIFSFLNQKCDEGFRLQENVYEDLIEELKIQFPFNDEEKVDYHNFWNDCSLYHSKYEPVTGFGVSFADLLDGDIELAFNIISKHGFIYYEPQSLCFTLPNGIQFQGEFREQQTTTFQKITQWIRNLL